MKRSKILVNSRNSFIKKFFSKRKKENTDISVKEISNELADWYIFISARQILSIIYKK